MTMSSTASMPGLTAPSTDKASGASFTTIPFSQTLERLSLKPGVVASLVVDRASNALLQSSGTFTFWNAPTAIPSSISMPASTASSSTLSGSEATTTNSTTHFTAMVVRYVESTGELVAGMDSEDDLKLLRVRTKKHEIVIVPDPKFIFVVVHEISG